MVDKNVENINKNPVTECNVQHKAAWFSSAIGKQVGNNTGK